MGDPAGPPPSGGDESAFLKRQADLEWVPADPDRTTSPEAIKVLNEEGVEAWRTWCQENAPV
jgi:hypothetical protein